MAGDLRAHFAGAVANARDIAAQGGILDEFLDLAEAIRPASEIAAGERTFIAATAGTTAAARPIEISAAAIRSIRRTFLRTAALGLGRFAILATTTTTTTTGLLAGGRRLPRLVWLALLSGRFGAGGLPRTLALRRSHRRGTLPGAAGLIPRLLARAIAWLPPGLLTGAIGGGFT